MKPRGIRKAIKLNIIKPRLYKSTSLCVSSRQSPNIQISVGARDSMCSTTLAGLSAFLPLSNVDAAVWIRIAPPCFSYLKHTSPRLVGLKIPTKRYTTPRQGSKLMITCMHATLRL